MCKSIRSSFCLFASPLSIVFFSLFVVARYQADATSLKCIVSNLNKFACLQTHISSSSLFFLLVNSHPHHYFYYYYLLDNVQSGLKIIMKCFAWLLVRHTSLRDQIEKKKNKNKQNKKVNKKLKSWWHTSFDSTLVNVVSYRGFLSSTITTSKVAKLVGRKCNLQHLTNCHQLNSS